MRLSSPLPCSMRVCIHRGAHEVGGSCIEIEHEGARLVLDVGLPLNIGFGDNYALPGVRGLREGDPSIVGLILSHGHPDHFGLVAEVHGSVPRYLGEATQRILQPTPAGSPALLSKANTRRPPRAQVRDNLWDADRIFKCSVRHPTPGHSDGQHARRRDVEAGECRQCRRRRCFTYFISGSW